MLRPTVPFLGHRLKPAARRLRETQKRIMKTKAFDPSSQIHKQRRDKAVSLTRRLGYDENDPQAINATLRKLYTAKAPSENKKHTDGINSIYAFQGIGDDESLSTASRFGVTPEDHMKYENEQDLMNNMPAPLPYGKLHARKVATGELWPSAPTTEEGSTTYVDRIRNEEDMSPSARKQSKKLEFWIRRNLKRMPPEIAEKIDFDQIMIDRVVASRRTKYAYVFWSTTHPGARFQMEPHIKKLGPWTAYQYKLNCKNKPNIPQVKWVYNAGLATELPQKLIREAKTVHSDVSATLQERIEYLKRMDSLAARTKDIPWYMPYLWNKDDKMKKQRQLLHDVEAMEKRDKDKASFQERAKQEDAHSQAPSFVR